MICSGLFCKIMTAFLYQLISLPATCITRFIAHQLSMNNPNCNEYVFYQTHNSSEQARVYKGNRSFLFVLKAGIISELGKKFLEDLV